MSKRGNGDEPSLERYYGSPIKNKSIDRFMSSRLTSSGGNIGLRTAVGDVGVGTSGSGLDISINKSGGISRGGGDIFGSAGLRYNTKSGELSGFGSADASYNIPTRRGSITGMASGSIGGGERFGSAGLAINRGNTSLSLSKDTMGGSSASLSYSRPFNIGRVTGDISGNVSMSGTSNRGDKPAINAGVSYTGTINYGKKRGR